MTRLRRCRSKSMRAVLVVPGSAAAIACPAVCDLVPSQRDFIMTSFRLPDVLTVIKNPLKTSCIGWLVLGAANAFGATPTIHGQSGYINMPNAYVEADGTFSAGYGYDTPYGSLWATATVLPFLQVTGRFVSINGIPGFTSEEGQFGSNYGRYKDKVVDVKARLWQESGWLPSVAIGASDLQGTGLFKGQYVVASKTFGAQRNFEATLGYGLQGYVGRRSRSRDSRSWRSTTRITTRPISAHPKRTRGNAAKVRPWAWNTAGAGLARRLRATATTSAPTPM
jgi:hypothetical protein